MLHRKFKESIFIIVTGNAQTTHSISLSDGSYVYRGRSVSQTFTSCLVDNVGSGLCKISFEPHIDFEGCEGYKTLFPKDCFYIESTIGFIQIYFVQDSIVELVLGAIVYEN